MEVALENRRHPGRHPRPRPVQPERRRRQRRVQIATTVVRRHVDLRDAVVVQQACERRVVDEALLSLDEHVRDIDREPQPPRHRIAQRRAVGERPARVHRLEDRRCVIEVRQEVRRGGGLDARRMDRIARDPASPVVGPHVARLEGDRREAVVRADAPPLQPRLEGGRRHVARRQLDAVDTVERDELVERAAHRAALQAAQRQEQHGGRCSAGGVTDASTVFAAKSARSGCVPGGLTHHGRTVMFVAAACLSEIRTATRSGCHGVQRGVRRRQRTCERAVRPADGFAQDAQ